MSQKQVKIHFNSEKVKSPEHSLYLHLDFVHLSNLGNIFILNLLQLEYHEFISKLENTEAMNNDFIEPNVIGKYVILKDNFESVLSSFIEVGIKAGYNIEEIIKRIKEK
ncbi:MAG: hypothetical protein A2Y33_05195 [Spirochaetes bacterium GWF1_51_8]|nr:MAG: hypothetical protein A2Y33_05195 [Spirochaetes bacterium GWF1_51_8]